MRLVRRRKHHVSAAIAPSPINADINVTPLVDVCLVLLIIFMVVTPMLQKGVDVLLPETKSPDKIPETEKQTIVAVKSDGSAFIGQNWIPKNQLLMEFKKMKAEEPDKEIVIKGDRRLKYKDVRDVMKLLNDAGWTKVGLIVMKKDTSSPI
jgi:biopolymer transport protein ExbD